MTKIIPGKFVEIVYDLYKINEDGSETLVHQGDDTEPESFVYGVSEGIVVPLFKDLYEKVEGDTFDIVAQPQEAYGERDEDSVITLDKDVFVVDGKFDNNLVKPGAFLPMMTADGFRIQGQVTAVSENTVTMDFNHILAGSPVRYKGKVLTVEDATEEQIKAAKSECSCGCHHDHCGCGDECGCHHDHCDCGDECGCGDDCDCGCKCEGECKN